MSKCPYTNFKSRVLDYINILRRTYIDENTILSGYVTKDPDFGWSGTFSDFEPSIGYWINTPTAGWLKFRYGT